MKKNPQEQDLKPPSLKANLNDENGCRHCRCLMLLQHLFQFLWPNWSQPITCGHPDHPIGYEGLVLGCLLARLKSSLTQSQPMEVEWERGWISRALVDWLKKRGNLRKSGRKAFIKIGSIFSRSTWLLQSNVECVPNKFKCLIWS